MGLRVTGGSAEDAGPGGCVVRFLLAGDARDEEACRAELHEDSLEQAQGNLEPPPMQAADVGQPEADGDVFRVPVQFVGNDGTDQPFVFVVRPAATRSGYGIDLQATMEATFGGDPAEMMMEVMKEAFAPIGEAMEGLAEGLRSAFEGDSGAEPPATMPRRLEAHDPLPPVGDVSVEAVVLEVVRMEHSRSVGRAFGEEGTIPDTDLTLRCRFQVSPDVVLQACAGVTLTRATSTDGEDLVPEDADETLGSETWSSWEQERRDWSVSLRLRPPGPGFSGLARLEGVIRLRSGNAEGYEVLAGRVGDLAGTSLHVASLGGTVAFVLEDGAFTIRAPSRAFDDLGLDVVFTDGSGENLHGGYSAWGDGETTTRDVGAVDPDLLVLLRFRAQGEVLEVPFAARGLPLLLP